jgi:hypothetical protein
LGELGGYDRRRRGLHKGGRAGIAYFAFRLEELGEGGRAGSCGQLRQLSRSASPTSFPRARRGSLAPHISTRLGSLTSTFFSPVRGHVFVPSKRTYLHRLACLERAVARTARLSWSSRNLPRGSCASQPSHHPALPCTASDVIA